MSVRIWSRASACVLTGCCRCSSPLAHALQRAALHFKHQSALGIACVRQFSPLLRYLPDPIALTTLTVPLARPRPLTPAPLPPLLPFEGSPMPVATEPLDEPTALLPDVTTTLIPLPTLLPLLVLLPLPPPPPPTTTLIPPEVFVAPLPAVGVVVVGDGTPQPPLVVPEVPASPPLPTTGLSGGFLLLVAVMLPLEIMLRFCDR
uniref:Uncharacterized protein n=1 Tax=Anopheles christyi TaxID=43041 RepID=A0A182KJ19_9DIPT